ncbi:hypothetical protein [Marinococcus luteus]|uniref:hypothetical protein n=1 Tax=Marinococcus luteus TaxID=1122204 RepID=UPI002ACC6C93|nr:hypothetical protein [Marinococcus luteus]MDZ5783374.1 hypothetical protein [Marinococcus luteus]
MEFNHYKSTVEEYLENYYENLIQKKVPLSERMLESFLNNELANMNSYKKGVMNEIKIDVEEFLEKTYNREQVDHFMKVYSEKVYTNNFSFANYNSEKIFSRQRQTEKEEPIKDSVKENVFLQLLECFKKIITKGRNFLNETPGNKNNKKNKNSFSSKSNKTSKEFEIEQEKEMREAWKELWEHRKEEIKSKINKEISLAKEIFQELEIKEKN